MKKLIIEIETGNAAFDDEPNAELARIVREAATKIANGDLAESDWTLRDSNGNRAGFMKLENNS